MQMITFALVNNYISFLIMKRKTIKLLQLIKRKVLEINPNAQILLYGSRARGTEHTESDWDLLILLDKDKIEDSDFDQISYPLVELGWKEGEQFSPKLYTMKDWMQRSFTLFYKNIEKEGIVLRV